MQEQRILPYKRRVDIHGIDIPFDQLLRPGETIAEGSCVVSVYSGIDPDPAHMLEGNAQVRGSNLYQQIKFGLPGVVYILVFTASTDLGNTYKVAAKQAVLEDQIPAGPIYQYYYFTTTPYPLNVYDEIGVSSTPTSGYFLAPPIDLISVTSSIVAGELRDLLRVYSNWPPEGLDVSSDILAGTLRDILITYTMAPEGFNLSSSIRGGTLRDVLITYSNYPAEGINLTSNIIAGSLL